MIPLEIFLINCEVGITDLGYKINGKGIEEPILGSCPSLLPLKEDGNPRYIVYISDYVLNNGFTPKEKSDLILHEKLHLYCLTFFNIETEDIFIDYWIMMLETNLPFRDIVIN